MAVHCCTTYLSTEFSSLLGWVILAVSSNVSTTDILDRHVLHVETNVVTGKGLSECGVVHLHRLDLSGEVSRGKGDDHTGLQTTSLHTTDWDRSNT